MQYDCPSSWQLYFLYCVIMQGVMGSRHARHDGIQPKCSSISANSHLPDDSDTEFVALNWCLCWLYCCTVAAGSVLVMHTGPVAVTRQQWRLTARLLTMIRQPSTASISMFSFSCICLLTCLSGKVSFCEVLKQDILEARCLMFHLIKGVKLLYVKYVCDNKCPEFQIYED